MDTKRKPEFVCNFTTGCTENYIKDVERNQYLVTINFISFIYIDEGRALFFLRVLNLLGNRYIHTTRTNHISSVLNDAFKLH